MSNASRLIVCEKTGVWAKVLRRSLDDGGRWIVETRGYGQLAGALNEHPRSLCLVEITAANTARAAACLAELHLKHPQCQLIAACEHTIPAIEHAVREAHAVFVLHSRRDVDILGRLWRSHCRDHPPREQSLREQIFASLPWATA